MQPFDKLRANGCWAMRAGFLALTGALAGCSAGAVPEQQRTAAAGPDCGQDFFKLTGRVVDKANILALDVEQRLTAKLAALERSTGHQLVVATADTLQGKTIDAYSLCLANHWGIGRAREDDGVLMLVAPVERVARIEVGLGLETELRNEEAKQILDRHMFPAFKGGNFAQGIEAGADAIAREIG